MRAPLPPVNLYDWHKFTLDDPEESTRSPWVLRLRRANVIGVKDPPFIKAVCGNLTVPDEEQEYDEQQFASKPVPLYPHADRYRDELDWCKVALDSLWQLYVDAPKGTRKGDYPGLRVMAEVSMSSYYYGWPDERLVPVYVG